MELTPLRYLIRIAEERHVTRAARKLGVSQPALSAMLRKLEAELGTALLDRTGRGVELTAAGREFLVHARDAVLRADAGVDAVKQMSGLQRGSIRVGGGATATTYLLPRVVWAVRKAHPGLRFYVREAGSATVAAAVIAGELDVGIVTLPMPLEARQELLVINLVDDELRLIVPPSAMGRGGAKGTASGAAGGSAHGATASATTSGRGVRGAKQGGTFAWKDLRGEPIVAFEAGTAVREIIDAASARAGVTLDVVMELRSIESIKQMVAAGIGVGFVSRFALRAGEGLSATDGRLSRKLAIVRRRDRTPSAAAATFERQLLASVQGEGAGRG